MRKQVERRLAKLEQRRAHQTERPPWEIEGREPVGGEELLWLFEHGWTLEQLIRGSQAEDAADPHALAGLDSEP